MVLDELMDWHELNCCHPERHQVIDHGGVRKACIGAAKIFRHTRVVLREALEVRFVDDGLVERRLRRAIASPVEEGVVHHGLGDVRCTVLKVGSEFVCEVVRIAGRFPVDLAIDRTRVRVEQQQLRIAEEAVSRVVWSVHPVAVTLAGSDAVNHAVPHAERAFGELHSMLGTVRVDQTQLYPFGDSGSDRGSNWRLVGGAQS